MQNAMKIAFVWLAALAGVLLASPSAHAQDASPATPAANPAVTIGHFAPFAADVAGTAVDVRVDGTQVFTGVVYGTFEADVPFAAGATLVELVQPGTDTVIISTTQTLEEDKRYYLLAIGGVNSQPLALRWQEIATVIPADKALITVGHLAPFNSNLALTAVNICTDADELVVGNLRYGDIRANLPFDPGLYDLKITSTAGGCTFLLFDMPPFFLALGSYRDAFAIGLIGSSAFPPNIVTTTGLQNFFNFLPSILTGALVE